MNSEVEGLTTSPFLLLVLVINEAMKHIKQYVYNLFSQHVKYKISPKHLSQEVAAINMDLLMAK